MVQQESGCVLFADVSGSTKLYEAVGDAAAHAAIDACVKMFSDVTSTHSGRVVKTIGDEVMSVFPSAIEGARAASEMQNNLSDMEPVGGITMGARIGFHFGPIVERAGDIFGDTVNLAARLTEMAAKGQIITSLESVELLDALLKMQSRRLYSIPVKGKEKEVDICELLWTDTDEATTMVAHRHEATRPQATRLKLSYGGRTIVIPDDRKSLVLGRDASADLVIADRMASRAHCEIEVRQGKFVIGDRSANGTFVSVDGETEMVCGAKNRSCAGTGSSPSASRRRRRPRRSSSRVSRSTLFAVAGRRNG
jgi:class 3 adenylate cyclase